MNLTRQRRLVVILVAAGAAFSTLAAFSLSASSHVSSFHSVITIQYDNGSNNFSGKVNSAPECRRNRKVLVYQQVTGNDVVVGRTTTAFNGDWGGIGASGPGFYYAKVFRTARHGGYGDNHRCESAESRSISLTGSEGRSYSSTVTIQFQKSGDSFSGKVNSTNHECTEGRKVQVLAQVSGQDPVIGQAFTGEDGRWTGIASAGPGNYYAKVFRTAHGNAFRCQSDESQTITVRG